MWSAIFSTLSAKSELSIEQIDFAFEQMLSENADPIQVRQFLEALKDKGESATEIRRATEIILSKSHDFPRDPFQDRITIDTCGTGGDGLHTLNISTMVALVVASTGTTVLKHGNRAASSRSGSADVLEALGININPSLPTLVESALQARIAFLFAQAFHPALKFVAPIRREIGTRTIFNYLGPLVNPARPTTQIVGVSEKNLAGVVAESLAQRGVRAIVLRGLDGLDEISIATPTDVWIALSTDQTVKHLQISPQTFGEKPQPLEKIQGGEPHENAQAILDLAGGRSNDVIASAVAMNAACALVAIDSHSGPIDDFEVALLQRYQDVLKIIHSGLVGETLELWRQLQR